MADKAKTAERTNLAERMEIIGRVFEIDGMSELLDKYQTGMTSVKFNAVTIQVSALLLREDKELADRIIAMVLEESEEEIQKLTDAEYATALRNAIIKDVMGFFVSSPATGGGK